MMYKKIKYCSNQIYIILFILFILFIFNTTLFSQTTTTIYGDSATAAAAIAAAAALDAAEEEKAEAEAIRIAQEKAKAKRGKIHGRYELGLTGAPHWVLADNQLKNTFPTLGFGGEIFIRMRFRWTPFAPKFLLTLGFDRYSYKVSTLERIPVGFGVSWLIPIGSFFALHLSLVPGVSYQTFTDNTTQKRLTNISYNLNIYSDIGIEVFLIKSLWIYVSGRINYTWRNDSQLLTIMPMAGVIIKFF